MLRISLLVVALETLGSLFLASCWGVLSWGPVQVEGLFITVDRGTPHGSLFRVKVCLSLRSDGWEATGEIQNEMARNQANFCSLL